MVEFLTQEDLKQFFESFKETKLESFYIELYNPSFDMVELIVNDKSAIEHKLEHYATEFDENLRYKKDKEIRVVGMGWLD